jgi:hypothetical protein
MMTKKPILLLITLGLLFLLFPTVQANGYWFPMSLNQSINAPLFSLQYYHIVRETQYSREKFEFNWTSGIIAVNFYIFTGTDFENWEQGQPTTPYFTHDNMSADAYNFTPTGANQTWVFVWYNPSPTSTQLLGELDRYRWIEVDSPIPGFPWEALLLGAISAITLTILVRKKLHQK